MSSVSTYFILIKVVPIQYIIRVYYTSIIYYR
nr:MAG TPA: hypothetical protein [Caudoviricetes sp.]